MGHLFVRSSIVVLVACAIQACSSSDSTPSSSGGTSGSSGSSGSSGTSGAGTSGTSGSSGGGSCAGDIANCAIGTLSTAQQNDMCSILSAAIDDPPGTKLECMQPDQYIVVNSKENCIAMPAKASCKITVNQLVGCFRAAKKDACPAFATGGACEPLFDPASGCL